MGLAIATVWSNTTRDERERWHNFTCKNSRAPLDVLGAQDLTERFKREIERTEALKK